MPKMAYGKICFDALEKTEGATTTKTRFAELLLLLLRLEMNCAISRRKEKIDPSESLNTVTCLIDTTLALVF
jgi:hypothetical protein